MALTGPTGNSLHPNTVRMIKEIVFTRDNWKCVKCKWRPPKWLRHLQIGAPREQKGARFLTVDHIVPVSKGGLSTVDNLQTMCNHCNEEKGSATQRWTKHKHWREVGGSRKRKRNFNAVDPGRP